MKTNTTPAGKIPAISEKQSLKRIGKLHGEILEAARTSLPKAIKIGELLTGIKDRMEHGKWLPWIQKNLPFSERTAQNYMRCFEEKDRLKNANVADLSGAYLLVSDPKATPEPLPADDLNMPVPQASLVEFLRGKGITLSANDFIPLITIGQCYEAGGTATAGEILDVIKLSRTKGEEVAA